MTDDDYETISYGAALAARDAVAPIPTHIDDFMRANGWEQMVHHTGYRRLKHKPKPHSVMQSDGVEQRIPTCSELDAQSVVPQRCPRCGQIVIAGMMHTCKPRGGFEFL